MQNMLFKKILVPTDFSEYSERGICAAIEMAHHFDRELYFINVWPPEFMFEAELRAKVDPEVKQRLEEETLKRNVGINAGESAGQTVFHCHVHLIPRREGDVENPRGGVRGVITGRQDY